jgi:hypothetical protein
MPTKPLNPLRLAVLLHWDPEDTAPAATSPEAKRILDYWLQQIEHFDPVFAPEYVEAPVLLSELLIEEASHEGRQAKVREDSRFHHWGLCQHLLGEAQRAVASSALLSRELTELAVLVAMRLDPGHYHLSWTQDLRSKAWCLNADANRRLNHTEASLEALAKAKRHSQAGTGSPELAARIEKTEMSLKWRLEDRAVPSTEDHISYAGSGVWDDPSSHSRVV